MGYNARLRIWVITFTLINHAFSGVALAIPLSATITEMDTSPTSLHLRFFTPKADLDIVSANGMFDSSPAAEISSADADSGGLMPIREVLQAMMNQAATSLSSNEQPTASFTTTAVYPLASPPKQGPGIVLLSSTVLPGFSTTSRSPEPTSTSTDAANASVKNINSSRRVIILGSVIGGILCVLLFIFFILDPSITSKFFGLFSLRKFRSGKKDRGISHMAEPSFMVVDRGTPERTIAGVNGSRYSASPSPEKGEKSDSTHVGIHAQPVLSKFSICSSDYLSASTRDSAVTSTTMMSDDLASGSNVSALPARPSTVVFAATPRPARPPRPPTADSPALSDSVYLACSNQPYVIVAPPPLAKSADAAPEPTPKKMLTPSEFFALHVPGIISSLVGNHAGNNNGGSAKKERDRATMAAAHQRSTTSGVARTGSQHSRTKSAPLLSSLRSVMTRAAKTAAVSSDSQDTAGDGGDIAQRVTKHRRSRSASGWAYPDRFDRLISRKTFAN